MDETDFSDVELTAFLDEALPAERSASIERAARQSESLRRRLARLRDQNTAGYHTIGQIWRARRVSCPADAALKSYASEPQNPANEPVHFHVQTVGCRRCGAAVDEIIGRSAGDADARRDQSERRQRLFASSAGLLRRGSGGA